MKGLEALKRLRQETAPATYMKDFDKEECCNVIETELRALEIIKTVCPNVFWVVRSKSFKEYTPEELGLEE